MPVSTKGFTGQVVSQMLRKALPQWDLWVPEVWSALVGNDSHSEVRDGWGGIEEASQSCATPAGQLSHHPTSLLFFIPL